MPRLEEFSAILTANAPLAPLVGLGVGGPADFLARPRSVEELDSLRQTLEASETPWRILGSGSNVLPPDEGVRGVVVMLDEPAFRTVEIEQNRLSAGGGTPLADVAIAACAASLAGLEPFVSSPGTIGGALRTNVGDLGQQVFSLDLLERAGRVTRMKSELRFGFRRSNIDDAVVLSATFELAAAKPDDVVRRVKKTWMGKNAQQDVGRDRMGQAFVNPRGSSAATLVERSGVRGAKVGGAELAPHDAASIVVREGATSRDVHRLLELVGAKVLEQTGVRLEVQFDLW